MTNTNPIITSYESLVYKTKATMKMFWCFLQTENKYLVILRPWSDQAKPLDYLKMSRLGEPLPKNVALKISDDPKVLAAWIENFEPEKSKYKRKRRSKKTITDTHE